MSQLATPFTVIIPARMASTRLPNKPLLDLAGQPMIIRVAKQAQKSKAQTVIVATDSPEILAVCQREGIEALLTDTTHRSGTDRLAQAATLLKLDDTAIIVNLQGDEPLIEPGLLTHLAAHLEQHSDCAIATAAHPINKLDDILNPNVVKVVCDAQHRALYFSRAAIPWQREYETHTEQTSVPQQQAVLRHIGLYAYRVKFLRQFPALTPAPLEITESLEQLRALWHGEKIAVLHTHHTPATGVDTPEDLARVRSQLTSNMA